MMTIPIISALMAVRATNAELSYRATDSPVSRQRIQARIATAAPIMIAATLIAMSSARASSTPGKPGLNQTARLIGDSDDDQEDDRGVETGKSSGSARLLLSVHAVHPTRRSSTAPGWVRRPTTPPYTRAMSSGLSARGHGPAVPRILLVDDDRDLLVPLAEQLRLDGFDVTTARDGEEALRRLDSAWPDLLIIDLLMPRMDGLTLAREIKARADLPIIVLSAIDAGDNKADLLDEFAEDYITKPYHYSELRARIQRVLRRVGDRVPRKGLDLGPDLVLELHQRRAIVGGEPVQLTPTESRLLFALAANLGQIVTTETLLSRGWAETDEAEPSYVWVTMRRLRQKLEVDANRPRHLLTARGVGYRLMATGPSAAGDVGGGDAAPGDDDLA